MKALKIIFLSVAGLIATLLLIFFLVGGSSGLASFIMPEQPHHPEPVANLAQEQSGKIYFSSSSPFDLDVILAGETNAFPSTSHGELFLPVGANASNPVPLLVLTHGSSGLGSGREEVYTQLLLQAGIGVFILDYYGSRGITEDMHYMAKLFTVTEIDALADAYSALKILQTHPAINKDKIALAGYSYGGMAIRFALDKRIQEAYLGDGNGFAAFIDFYGPCFQIPSMTKTNGAPLLTLRGDEDASNDLQECKKREQEIQSAGSIVESHIFEGAGHAWDVPSYEKEFLPEYPYVANCEVQYDNFGNPAINGTALDKLPLDASREERVVARIKLQLNLSECLVYGYVNGKHESSIKKSDEAFMKFLNAYLVN